VRNVKCNTTGIKKAFRSHLSICNSYVSILMVNEIHCLCFPLWSVYSLLFICILIVRVIVTKIPRSIHRGLISASYNWWGSL